MRRRGQFVLPSMMPAASEIDESRAACLGGRLFRRDILRVNRRNVQLRALSGFPLC